MVVCSSCEVATLKVDLKVDNKMHTNNIVAQRCLQCWLSQLTLPIHGFKNIDSRTSSQLWYWLNMWWCSWLLLMSLTVFLCPVFVLTSQQNTVPLPLFYFLCFFPWLRQACKGMEWQKEKRANAANQPRTQLCAVHVHVIRGNWGIIVKQICFLSSLILNLNIQWHFHFANQSFDESFWVWIGWVQAKLWLHSGGNPGQ